MLATPAAPPPADQPAAKRGRLEPSGNASTGAAEAAAAAAACTAGGSLGEANLSSSAIPITPPAANTTAPAAVQSGGGRHSMLSPPAFDSSGGKPRSPRGTAASRRAPPPFRAGRDSRGSALSAADKVERLLERYPQSFCEELQINMSSGSPDALWQWFCASVLFSARIKSIAGEPAGRPGSRAAGQPSSLPTPCTASSRSCHPTHAPALPCPTCSREGLPGAVPRGADQPAGLLPRGAAAHPAAAGSQRIRLLRRVGQPSRACLNFARPELQTLPLPSGCHHHSPTLTLLILLLRRLPAMQRIRWLGFWWTTGTRW
jgi:hypothetical protein